MLILMINIMSDDSVWSTLLEQHSTKRTSDGSINGSLTVVWRDWDDLIKDQIKMIYVSSVNTGEIKGPHLHTKRNSYFLCIHGKVVFIIKKDDGYVEIESSSDKPVLVYVPRNVPSAHINLADETSRVLALADLAWRPNDNEMVNVTFDDYDWKKWKKSQ
jgi:dTDP-4-dehydrorhamnose 3,5-epimerase